jgi:hypothetical protein
MLAAWGGPVLIQALVEGGDEYDVVGLGDGKGGIIGMCQIRKTIITPAGKAFGGIVCRAAQLVEMRKRLHTLIGHLVPCINLGGGFPSSNLLHVEPEDTTHPPIEAYAKAIAHELNKLPVKQRPQLRVWRQAGI